ncbi:MAG: hypothetical protein AAGD06_01260 [Acidobacteriota bacterium]
MRAYAPDHHRAHRGATAYRAAVAMVLALGMAGSAWSQATPPKPLPELRVYAHSLLHRPAADALPVVRPILSPRGAVEEQPGRNTLVIRDTRTVISKVAAALVAFDQPPEALRLDIRVVRAGPRPAKISPPEDDLEAGSDELPPDLLARIKTLLRYEDYRILAEASVSSREGEEVTYSLGDHYDVSFRLGNVLARQRLKVEDFRIAKKVPGATNKGRRLEPRELFHATLNLPIDKPFTLVIAQDEVRQEALLVAISCQRETEAAP